MPRWEFHLSSDETGAAARWAWMYRVASGDATTSERTFATYRDCLADALLHGYSAAGLWPRGEHALRADH